MFEATACERYPNAAERRGWQVWVYFLTKIGGIEPIQKPNMDCEDRHAVTRLHQNFVLA